jgi:hypothetical protein
VILKNRDSVTHAFLSCNPGGSNLSYYLYQTMVQLCIKNPALDTVPTEKRYPKVTCT